MAKYSPSGLGLAEPGANRASSPKAGSKYAKPINPNKDSGQLDAAIGKGPDASYQAFTKQQAAQPKIAAPKTAGGTPSATDSAVIKVPKAPAPAHAAPTGLLGKISTYGKAFITSPTATVKDVVTHQGIKAVDNGAIIVNRMPEQASQAQKKADGKTGPNYKLDHTQSLEIGGDNNPKNLKDVPTKQWASYTPVEDYLGSQLKANKINAQQAQKLMSDFKSGKVSAQDTINAAQKQPKGQSLTSKVTKVAKGVGGAVVTSENTVAKPIARLLPGGQNDLKAENAQIDQNIKLTQQISKLRQSSNPKDQKLAVTLEKENKANIASTSNEVNATAKEIKTDTNRGRIAAGVAGTAADILTAGTLPEIKGASLLSKTARVATKAGSFGTAGALNSAAGGGDKKQVAENFVAGAALPGIFHVAGKAGGAAVEKVTGGQATKDLITNSKTRSLLDSNKPPATANLDANTQKSLNTLMSKLHTPKSVTDAAQAEADNTAATHAAAQQTAEQTQKVAEQGKKIDNQIELITAKKADGKFTNVDQTKIKQLKQQKVDLGIPETAPAEGSIPKSGGAKPTVAPAAAPTGRTPQEVLSDIKANTNAVREATDGKTPADFTDPTTAPKEVQPLLQKHAALQSEYAAAKEAHAPAPVDTVAVKAQIKSVLNEDKNYDANGNVTPEAAKQIGALHAQLRSAGERIPKGEKPVTVTPIESTPRVEAPDIKTSKLAQGVETNAIKKGLTDGFEGKAEYASVNIDQQTKGAADLLKNDPGAAVRIAMGLDKPPEGLLPESVFIAVENQATKAGDHELLQRLATESHLTSEASGMGQRIRMLGERENHSPVAAIKQVADTRKAAAEKRLGKPVTKAVSEEVKQIRAAKPKVTKENWSSFIEGLKC